MLKKIFYFYIDGFKNLSMVGIKLWIIIGIKLFILFAILKIFFFSDFLDKRFESEKEKSDYIIEQIT